MRWLKVIEIISMLGGVGGLLGFIFKAGVKLRVERNSTGAGEEKRSKEYYYFWGGIIALILLVFVGVLLYKIIPDDTASPDVTNTKTTPVINTEPSHDSSATNEPDDYYIENMPCRGAIYTGYIDKETRLPNGRGKMVYNNGNIYEGDWVNGIQEGQGSIKFYNGDVYEGAWKNGKRDGYGVYTWSDGRIYEGEYSDDKREGEGSYIGWTGYVSTYGWKGTYYGNHKNDTFEGYGTFEFENGDTFKGVFMADKFWNGVYTRSDGSKYDIVNGKAVSQ